MTLAVDLPLPSSDIDGNNQQSDLPAEICAAIINSVAYSQQDLYSLIRVSRVFHNQCKASLYVNISLRGIYAMKVWSNTVREHPELSLATKSIAFRLPRKIITAQGSKLPFLGTGSDVDTLENVGRALKTCIDLEDLQILQMDDPRLQLVDISNLQRESLPKQLLSENIEFVNGKQIEDRGRPNDSHVHRVLRKDLPFKLKTFSNDFFLVHTLTHFFASQPSLKMMTFGRGACVVTSGHKMMVESLTFQNLRILDTTGGVLHKLRDCKLDTVENVRCEMTDYTDFEDLTVYDRLARLENLRSLWVVRKYYGTFRNSIVFARRVLSITRKLKYLKISDYTEHPIQYSTDVETWRMLDFGGLETLVFRTPVRIVNGAEESIYPDLQGIEGKRTISRIFMQDLASLKRFELFGDKTAYRVVRTNSGFEETEGAKEDESDWMAKF